MELLLWEGLATIRFSIYAFGDKNMNVYMSIVYTYSYIVIKIEKICMNDECCVHVYMCTCVHACRNDKSCESVV